MLIRKPLFAAGFLLAGTLLPFILMSGAQGQRKEKTRPRLAVLVVFDQMRGDYLVKWEKLFRGGFHRLQKEGAWFQNCHYPYAGTLTAPGHASLATGTSPYKHGIIANDWYDRASGDLMGAVRSEKHRPVPMPANPSRNLAGSAPVRRQQPAVGDALLQATAGKAKVVSISLKDRAAILLAALRALCFWFSPATGMFGTSTYYSDGLPPWVLEFNRGRPADKWLDKKWDRLFPELDYARYSGPDNVPEEGTGYFQGRTFPHSLNARGDKADSKYYQAMLNSPFGSELLLAFARKAIDEEKLGRHEVPDLLCLSFSSTDLIGHCWGPDSQEVLDVTLQSDRIMNELLNFLDDKVGRGQYLLVVTADHGVCPIPELARARGKKAGRISSAALLSGGSAYLDKHFGAKSIDWIEAMSDGNIYLNRKVIKELKLDADQVEKALAAWLYRQPGIQAAYTRAQLSQGPIRGDPTGEAVRLSYYPGRSGDVVVVVEPYHLYSSSTILRLATYSTTHGSPHPYDTHVPLLVYGPGIRPGIRHDQVVPQSAAAILARGLGISPPAGAEAPIPDGLFAKP